MTLVLRLLSVLLAVSAVIATAPADAEPGENFDDVGPMGVWPLQPEPVVERGFDPPELPYGAGHRGVDLLGTPGQVVHTALAGVVVFSGRIAGRGVVVVSHGDTRTTYEPVDATVRVATQLAQGAPIGSLTQSGSHCLPRACLHWGWLRGETYLDPLLLVGYGPVRLLPLQPGPLAPPVPLPSVAAPPTPRPQLVRVQALGCACW